MARGVWRRSGEAFSAYCARQIKAHNEEIERCEIIARQRAQDGYHGAAMFYNGKAVTERAGRMQWRRLMRAALITEGQAGKNSIDTEQRLAARIKLQSANSSYGKFSPLHNPEIPEAITETARQELVKWITIGDPTPRH